VFKSFLYEVIITQVNRTKFGKDIAPIHNRHVVLYHHP